MIAHKFSIRLGSGELPSHARQLTCSLWNNFASFFVFACPEKESVHWIHCIEYIFFIIQNFKQPALALTNRICAEIFYCIEIFFIFQDFWATWSCPENRACPEFFKPGGAAAAPPPRTPLLGGDSSAQEQWSALAIDSYVVKSSLYNNLTELLTCSTHEGGSIYTLVTYGNKTQYASIRSTSNLSLFSSQFG